MHVITVDCGTSSLRSMVFSPKGTAEFASRRQYGMEYPREGWVETPPVVWRDALLETLADCAAYTQARGIAVAAVAVTSQRSSVFPIDEQGEPLGNAIMWHDKRSVPICQRLEPHKKDIYRKTGMRPDPIFSAPKMIWLRENCPDIYKKSYKLVGVHEFLLHTLCGQFVQDSSVGSRSLLMNLRKHQWDDGLLQLYDLELKKLCPIMPVGSICGGLTSRTAQVTGLHTGLPVIGAGGDQQCALLGLGVERPGQIGATSGTGAYVASVSDQPVLDENMGPICNVAANGEQYILETTLPTAGAAYRWFCTTFYSGDEDPMAWGDAQAVRSPPGSNGVIVLPYLRGQGPPGWNPLMAGMFHGMTLATTTGDMARAMLEGIALEISVNVALLGKLTGGKAGGEIAVSGGLTRFDLYNQILADASGRPVVRKDDGEATAKGAWKVAAATLGLWQNGVEEAGEVFQPRPDYYSLYQELLHKRNILCEAAAAIACEAEE